MLLVGSKPKCLSVLGWQTGSCATRLEALVYDLNLQCEGFFVHGQEEVGGMGAAVFDLFFQRESGINLLKDNSILFGRLH